MNHLNILIFKLTPTKMKYTFITFFILIVHFGFGQSRGGQIITKTPPLREDVRYSNSSYINYLEQQRQLSIQNSKYIVELLDWILELNEQTNDKDFLTQLYVYYEKLLSYDGKNKTYIYDELKLIENEIHKTIDIYNKKIEERNDPINLLNIAQNYYKNNQFNLAIYQLDKLLSKQNDFFNGYYLRALCYFYVEKYNYSKLDFDKAIELNNKFSDCYKYRGWTKFYLNDFQGAMFDFNKQIELDPNSSSAYYNRAIVKSELNDKYGAIIDYDKSIQFDPNNSNAYNNRGWVKFELNKPHEALKDINIAIQLDNTNTIAWDSRQEIKFALKDYKGCINDCNTALGLDPNISNVHFFRGRAYYRLGNKQQACIDWSKAGELGSSEAYEYISKYCQN
jgi:tetratricopeptide (TPR) repeat protein